MIPELKTFFDENSIELPEKVEIELGQMRDFANNILRCAVLNVDAHEGLKMNLLKFSSIDSGNDGIDEREFHNTISELNGFRFVKEVLNLVVLDIEYNGHKILSPFREAGEKSCDLKYIDGNSTEHFLEIKDKSSDIINRNGVEFGEVYSMSTRPDIGLWIMYKLYECFQKGATNLFVKVPMSAPLNPSEDYFYNEWIHKVFDHFLDHISGDGTNNHIFRLKSSLTLQDVEEFDIPEYFDSIFIEYDDQPLEIKILPKETIVEANIEVGTPVT